MHWYGGSKAYSTYGKTVASQLIDRVKKIYGIYHKPIWLTEFSPADFQVLRAADDPFSQQDAIDFINEALPQLDMLPYVQRYFYQDSTASNTNAALLEDDDRTLTPVGEAYASYPK